mmetsp:Transcript_57592/g.134974  ORF Transcript_57592/g.134974 Transcript_57592/m.134974 type:complete len:200 (+) Transcript_57592:2266-2865(+)
MSQSFGTIDRKEASITALNSGRLMFPWRYLAKSKESTSHSSCSRLVFATFVAIASNFSRIMYIHLLSPKPMTAALKRNISLKFVGTFTSLRSGTSSLMFRRSPSKIFATPFLDFSPLDLSPDDATVVSSEIWRFFSPLSDPSPASCTSKASIGLMFDFVSSSRPSSSSLYWLFAIFQLRWMVLMRPPSSRRQKTMAPPI